MGQATESKNPPFPVPGKQWAIALSALGLLAAGTTGIYVLKLSQGEAADPLVTTEVSPPQIEAV